LKLKSGAEANITGHWSGRGNDVMLYAADGGGGGCYRDVAMRQEINSLINLLFTTRSSYQACHATVLQQSMLSSSSSTLTGTKITGNFITT